VSIIKVIPNSSW